METTMKPAAVDTELVGEVWLMTLLVAVIGTAVWLAARAGL
jgi:hypothetical protein